MSQKKSIFSVFKRTLSIALTITMAISVLPSFSFPVSATAAKDLSLPKAGSIPVSAENFTQNEPFARGTAGCERFRIPALITLQNGDLLATADARYGIVDGSDAPDGGGLDSIASVSSDGGKTWYYSFPFYFPDSDGYPGNNTRADATTIIDPAIIEGPDGTVYCIADVNPTGVTTMGGFTYPGAGTGYVTVDGVPRLGLTSDYKKSNTRPDSPTADYEYYVGDFNQDGFAPVLHMKDKTPSAYGVDEWYNLYSVENGVYKNNLTQVQVKQESKKSDPDVLVQQNAFYAGSNLHVYRTGYIMVVASKDHGRTWENPRIINTEIKKEGETALLVSPGKGITTKCGDIAVGFYQTVGGEQASIAYSTDNGSSWNRTDNVPKTSEFGRSSEDEIVELEDGTLRMFFRRGDYRDSVGTLAYADAVKQPDGSYKMSSPKGSPASLQTGCNITAISYSKKIDGKQAILVAGPSGVRANGVIHTFLVNDDADHSMELIHTYKIPEGWGGYASFVYSCLTELEDGSLGLLWEPNHYSIRFSKFDIADVVPDRTIEQPDPPVEPPVEPVKKIQLSCGESLTEPYSQSGSITEPPDGRIASIYLEKTHPAMYDHVDPAATASECFSKEANPSLLPSDAEFTFTGKNNAWQIENKSKNLYLANQSSENGLFSSRAEFLKVTPAAEQNTFQICKNTGADYLAFHSSDMTFYTETDDSGTDGKIDLILLERQEKISDGDFIPGYRQASSITNKKSYLIARLENKQIFILYPASGAFACTKRIDPAVSVNNPALVFTGITKGETSSVIDGVRYQINVTEEKEDPDIPCFHETVVKNEVSATCELPGYTGDSICIFCKETVKTGTTLPSLGGHKWSDGIITKKVSKTEDGTESFVCQNDSSHTKTETIPSSAYLSLLDLYEEAGRLIAQDLGMYEPDTANTFKDTYDSLQQAMETDEFHLSKINDLHHILTDAIKALIPKSADTLKQELNLLLDHAKSESAAQDGVSDIIWNAFTEAYQAAASVSDGADAKEIWPLIKNLEISLKNLNEARNQLTPVKNALAAAISKAESVYSMGQCNYTTESWNTFAAAYNEAVNAFKNAGADLLKALTEKLSRAQAGLEQRSASDGPADTVTYKKVIYKIQSDAKKTVSAAACADKKASAITIPATVTINNTKYKVVKIDQKAFSKCTKLKKITIGKHISAIDKYAFKGCKNLYRIILKGAALKPNKIKTGAFKNTSPKMKVIVSKRMKKRQRAMLLNKMKRAGMHKKATIL